MTIKILGSGCPTCQLLYSKVKKMQEEGKIKAEVQYIKDVNELIKRGILASPALLIDEKPIFTGVPDDEKILELIKENS